MKLRYYFIIACICIILVLFLLNQMYYVESFNNGDPMQFVSDSADHPYVKDVGYGTDLNTQYHDDILTIQKNPGTYGIPSGTKWVEDDLGNTKAVLNDLQASPVYYEPGSRSQYGSSFYVPSYEDSVYLSKYNTTMRSSLYADS